MNEQPAPSYRPLVGPIDQFLRNHKARGAKPDTRNALARAMGTDPVHLSRALNGKVPFTREFGERIAEVLAVRPDAVMEEVRTPQVA